MEKVFVKPHIDIQHYSLQWNTDDEEILDTEYWIGQFPFARPLYVDVIYQFALNDYDEENIKFILFKYDKKIYANIVVILEDHHKDIVVEVVKIPKSIDDLVDQSCLCETDGKYAESISIDLLDMISSRKTNVRSLFGDILEEMKKLKL